MSQNIFKTFIGNVLFLMLAILMVSCGGGGGGGSSGNGTPPNNNPTNVSKASLSPSTLFVQQGGSNNLTLTLTGGEARGVVFTLTSSDANVATLSVTNCELSSGSGTPNSCQVTVYGITKGNSTITATAKGFAPVSAQVTVQNSSVVGTLMFNESSENIVAGDNTAYATLSLVNSSGESIVAQVTSNDPSIVTVNPTTCNLSSGANNSCKISFSGKKSGVATVNATAGANYNAKMIVNVSANPEYGTISFDRTSIDLYPNNTTTTTLSLSNSSGISADRVNLSSTDDNVVSILPSYCNLSSGLGLGSCVVRIKAVGSGVAQIKADSTYNGHKYIINPIAVNVESAGNLSFSTEVKGISQTVYSGQVYNAQFTFTNTSGRPVSLAKAVVTNSGQSLNMKVDSSNCSNKMLQNNDKCTISVSDMTMSITTDKLAQLNFVLTEARTNLKYQYNIDIAGVPYHKGYAAFRITNDENPDHQGYLVALGNDGRGQAVVKFDSSGLGSLIDSSEPYSSGAIKIPATPLGLVVYQPNYAAPNPGIGGLMYVSLDKPVYEPHGNVGIPPIAKGDPNQYINYSVYEPNVYNEQDGQLKAILDVTAINAVGVTQGFYGTDINTGVNQKLGMLSDNYDTLSTQDLYSQIKDILKKSWPNTWGNDSQFVHNSDGSWVGLRGLVNWIGDPSGNNYPDGFDKSIYTQYVNDLWTYYAQPGHVMLIDAGEISPGCILQASVKAGDMIVQPKLGSSCPITASTGPNTWTWSKFQPIDFVGGAPDAGGVQLGGANRTYKSMGKYISAAQSVGFLPYCGKSDFVYGPDSFRNANNKRNYWTAQYKCLDHYSQYGDSVMNQYDKIFHQYIPYNYGWAYDDALDISSAEFIDPTKSVFTMVIHKF